MTTHKFLENYIVCVAESEVEEYAEIVGSERVLPHPDECIGLGKKRQFIIDYFRKDALFMIDDDVVSFHRLYESEGGKMKITDAETIEAILLQGYRLAKEICAKVWTYSDSPK